MYCSHPFMKEQGWGEKYIRKRNMHVTREGISLVTLCKVATVQKYIFFPEGFVAKMASIKKCTHQRHGTHMQIFNTKILCLDIVLHKRNDKFFSPS